MKKLVILILMTVLVLSGCQFKPTNEYYIEAYNIDSNKQTKKDTTTTKKEIYDGKEKTFSSGTYEVGKDIPEGTYTMKPISGYDNVEIGFRTYGIGFNQFDQEASKSVSNISLVGGQTIDVGMEVTVEFLPNHHTKTIKTTKIQTLTTDVMGNETCTYGDGDGNAKDIDCNKLKDYDYLKKKINKEYKYDPVTEYSDFDRSDPPKIINLKIVTPDGQKSYKQFVLNDIVPTDETNSYGGMYTVKFDNEGSFDYREKKINKAEFNEYGSNAYNINDVTAELDSGFKITKEGEVIYEI